ncbi:hypothetical protein [Sphingobium limneticum]|uniref:hypothetical protein n=1 Tax=Sphingobium limneticum TaxID=1007511 RepID=UPI00123E1DC3|nr:hypothetical protein [Sphingobium limneticum]
MTTSIVYIAAGLFLAVWLAGGVSLWRKQNKARDRFKITFGDRIFAIFWPTSYIVLCVIVALRARPPK